MSETRAASPKTRSGATSGLPLHRIAELSSANPARYHNLYPKKGAIMVGSDADFAIVDIDAEKEITVDTHGVGEVATIYFNTQMKPLDDIRVRRAVALALDREVPVSRGELVEIGGSFRIPEAMSRSGCSTAIRASPRRFATAIEAVAGAESIDQSRRLGAVTLGVANKFLEPWSGAVLAKIIILTLIILFIQKRPRGIDHSYWVGSN